MIRSIGVKNLSKKTIYRIERMIAAILAEPQFYNQDTFGEELCKNDGQQVCGTVCCAAGWAVWLDNRAMYQKMMKEEIASDGWNEDLEWDKAALKALDLEVDERFNTNTLFGSADCWPDEFYEMYLKATTPLQRAKALAKRWLAFIEADGIENY